MGRPRRLQPLGADQPGGHLLPHCCPRSRAQAEALLGDYRGVLVSDCLNIYDGLTPGQHKCYAHHLKEISKALEDPRARARPTCGSCAACCRRHRTQGRDDPPARRPDRAHAAALEANADRLLGRREQRPMPASAAPVEEKLRHRLRKQRDHLFTFLDHAAVEATNNLAERQLRPAVMSRSSPAGTRPSAALQPGRSSPPWPPHAARPALICRLPGPKARPPHLVQHAKQVRRRCYCWVSWGPDVRVAVSLGRGRARSTGCPARGLGLLIFFGVFPSARGGRD